jgi:hypothetical protein
MIRLRFSNAMPLALAFFREITRASILVLNRSIGIASSCCCCISVAETYPPDLRGRMGRQRNGRAESWGRVSKSNSFLPLSDAVVQVFGHGDGAQGVIDGLGRLQVLLGD